ncbi:MAG: GyrI-like domain-containing protein [Candidatus Saccharicenans sp.]
MKNKALMIFAFNLILTLILGLSLIWAVTAYEAQQLPPPGQVEIREVQPFVYCSLSKKGSFEEIEAAVGELMQHMQNQNVFPTGAMIGIYHGDPTLSEASSIQWEVGFPINEQAQVLAPLEKKQWTFTTVAVSVHEGPYEKTGETILKMREWLEDNGYVQNGPVLERYLDPELGRTSPERLRTEIWLPCKKI